MHQRVRGLWFWLKREIIAAFSACEYCGKREAYPCSVANLKRLCNKCAARICQDVERGYTIVDAPSVRINSVESLEYLEEEFPNFDTFPGPAPKVRNR
jgi:hypothetical protein